MRIWSIHPKYLDAKGLVALWREALLAKHVLEGKTRGYKNHPQLFRFKEIKNPIEGINQYLTYVYAEAIERDYNFDKSKIAWEFIPQILSLNSGQLDFERLHLLNKLKTRDNKKYRELLKVKEPEPNPLFEIIYGGIEQWEKTDGSK